MCGARQSGFALLELLFAISLFTLVLGICMFAAVSGFRIFGHANSRHFLQNNAAAIFTWLRNDVESSNLNFCTRERRMALDSVRDSLAIAGMDSWREPINKTPAGRPRWNRLLVYTATRDSDHGQLLRQSVAVPAADIPLDGPRVQNMHPMVLAGALPVGDQRRLAGGIKDFEVELPVDRQAIVFRLKLSEQVLAANSGRKRPETLEVETALYPRNTFPRI